LKILVIKKFTRVKRTQSGSTKFDELI